jgi:hypothetical protein
LEHVAEVYKDISSVGNRGGLKPLEATLYIIAAGPKEVLRSKRVEPDLKLETRSQEINKINKSQKVSDDESLADTCGDSHRKDKQLEWRGFFKLNMGPTLEAR